MDFKEASGIARKHPGTTVKRSADGSFVVIDSDHVVVDSDYKLKVVRRKLENAEKDAIKDKTEIKSLTTQLMEADYKLIEYEKKLSRIREEDWERIETRDEAERKILHEEMINKRRRVNCPCLGTVENCYDCYGRGYYETDGYGNKIY